MIRVVMGERIRVFNTSDRSDVFTDNSGGLIADIFPATLEKFREFSHDFGPVFAEFVGFSGITVKIV